MKLLVFCSFLFCSFVGLAQIDSISKTTKLGNQIWMYENLQTRVFRNGDSIPLAKNGKELTTATRNKMPICSAWNFDNSTIAINGLYYNYYAVIDPRGLAPEGFHIPKTDEVNKLNDYMFESFKKNDLKVFKLPKTWKGSKATNETGLSLKATGLLNYDGLNLYLKSHFYMWTSNTVNAKGNSYYVYITPESDVIHTGNNLDSGCMMSVRCIKD